MAEYLLTIDDMSCSHCVSAVTKALAGVPGLNVRTVALGSARVEGDAASIAAAVAALDRIGFPSRADLSFVPWPSEPRTPDR